MEVMIVPILLEWLCGLNGTIPIQTVCILTWGLLPGHTGYSQIEITCRVWQHFHISLRIGDCLNQKQRWRQAYVFGQCDLQSEWRMEEEPRQVCACLPHGWHGPTEPEEPFEVEIRSVCPHGMEEGSVFANWPLSPNGPVTLGIKALALAGACFSAHWAS